jgi:glutamate-1-semialdehyde aminotransferase
MIDMSLPPPDSWSRFPVENADEVLVPGAQDYLRFDARVGFPRFVVSSRGPFLVGMDGRECVDLYCASGAVILGHGDPGQVAYLCANLDHGASVSLRHPVELALAMRLKALIPGIDRWMFFKTGSECAHLALRLAAARTRRSAVLSLGYHGWVAPFGHPPESVGSFQVIEGTWDRDRCAAQIATLSHELAAAIVSPSACMSDPAFYLMLRTETERCGAWLIMDEIKSGCRWAFPCLSTTLNLAPDLLLLAKGLSNGYAIAALGGREAWLADPDAVSVFSTFASENVALFAASYCLQVLSSGAYRHFVSASTYLYERLCSELADTPVAVVGCPTFFRLEWPSEFNRVDVAKEMWKRGVLYHPKDEVLVSAAHDNFRLLDEQVARIREVAIISRK